MDEGSTAAGFGPLCAAAAGLLGLAYSVSFSLYLHAPSRGEAYADAIFLLAGGLVSTGAFTAIYARTRSAEPTLALWGYVLALVGAFGATLHGGYDLANLANPPASLATDLPSSVDPRGLGTFALTGLALAVIGVLILRGGAFPRPLGYLAFLSAALLVFVYVGRLVILNPKEPRAARGRGPCRLRRRPGVVRLGRALAAAPECDCGRTTVLT